MVIKTLDCVNCDERADVRELEYNYYLTGRWACDRCVCDKCMRGVTNHASGIVTCTNCPRWTTMYD